MVREWVAVGKIHDKTQFKSAWFEFNMISDVRQKIQTAVSVMRLLNLVLLFD